MLILLNSKSNRQIEMTSICFHSDRKHVPFSPSIWFQNSENQMWFTESMFSLFAVKNPFQSHHCTDHTNLIVFSTFTFYIIIQPVKLYWMAYDSEHIIILPFFCSILSPNLTFKILNLIFVCLFSVLSKMAEILQKKIQVNLRSHVVYYTLDWLHCFNWLALWSLCNKSALKLIWWLYSKLFWIVIFFSILPSLIKNTY